MQLYLTEPNEHGKNDLIVADDSRVIIECVNECTKNFPMTGRNPDGYIGDYCNIVVPVKDAANCSLYPVFEVDLGTLIQHLNCDKPETLELKRLLNRKGV
jgi:hypothetical protein